MFPRLLIPTNISDDYVLSVKLYKTDFQVSAAVKTMSHVLLRKMGMNVPKFIYENPPICLKILIFSPKCPNAH